MSAVLAPTTRPNGKVYRPRKAPIAQPVDGLMDGDGIIVLRTHDIKRAREVARRAWGQIDTDCTVDEIHSRRGWFRLVPWSEAECHTDYTWIDDSVHGTPGVLFGAWA